MITLQQLVAPVAEDDALQTILTILGQMGFQATSWQTGSIQLSFLRLVARIWSGVTGTISQMAAGGFTTLASSPWLELLAQYVYNITPLQPTPTIGKFTLTSSSGAPVHTWSAGDIIVADQPTGSSNANTYTVQAGTTLGPGSSVSITFKADVAGSAANIAPGTTLYLWTPLVGVTATNPVLDMSSTWITTPGTDDEAPARLAARCIAKWSALTYGNTDGAYAFWALTALPALSRLQVSSAPGNGTVTLIGATNSGPIDAGQITTIENYVNGISDGVGRRPINDIFTAVGATVVTSPSLTITAYVISAAQATAGASITDAVLAYINSVPIGGELTVGTTGRVSFSKMVAAAQQVNNVRNVVFSIGSDVLLSPGQIYQPTITVNVIPVAPGS